MYEDVENSHSRKAKEKKGKEREETLLGKIAAKLSVILKEKDPEKLRIIDPENKLREDSLFAMEQQRRKVMFNGLCVSVEDEDRKLSRERRVNPAAKLARKAERREIWENRKRRRRERELANLQNEPSPSDIKENGERYGLRLPQRGNNVRVKERVKPTDTSPTDRVYKRQRKTSRSSVADGLNLSNTSSLEEPAEKRRERERAAEELHRSRHEQIRMRDNLEEREAREEENDRLHTAQHSVVSRFVCDAISSRNDAIGDRIQQRKRRYY